MKKTQLKHIVECKHNTIWFPRDIAETIINCFEHEETARPKLRPTSICIYVTFENNFENKTYTNYSWKVSSWSGSDQKVTVITRRRFYGVTDIKKVE